MIRYVAVCDMRAFILFFSHGRPTCAEVMYSTSTAAQKMFLFLTKVASSGKLAELSERIISFGQLLCEGQPPVQKFVP
jgi:hypothetical protein